MSEASSTISDDDDAGDAPAEPHETIVLHRGAALGRYLVVDRLGEGGMGVVYAAYDPELDRKLAVKLLRDDAGGGVGSAINRRTRLLREAQALARLDHPNVVAVYDVGTHDDRVFVAMELVIGRTVAAWLAESPRSWREIREVYLQAGRGLAAAHALGIVHRDFKPENVLVDERGRVRVVDFGLARTDAVPSTEHEPSSESAAHAVAATTLTRTGALVGTPGYIAPEQQAGDARATVDQFSFCVALWKAVYGELPFAGSSAKELAAAASRGDLRAPTRAARVPAYVHRALVRGLASDPEARFPSLEALLEKLAGKRARRRYVAAGLAVAAIVAMGGAFALARPAEPHVCRGVAFHLDNTWDASRRAMVTRAFVATGVPYAATAATGVGRLLDQYAAGWTAMRTEACEATRVRGEQSEELLDLRVACLDQRARELRALGDVLVHADAKAVERSFQAALGLTPLAGCADAAELRAPIRPPANPAERARVAELGGSVAETRALDSAGKFGDAIARATTLVAAARAMHFRPLEASALTVLGISQRDAGNYEAAQASLESAVDAAIAAHDDVTAGDAASVLVRIIGYDRAKHDEAEPWIVRAQAFVEAQPDDRVKAQLENNIGTVRFGEERYDDALVHYRAGLELRRHLYGDSNPLVAASLDNMGLANDLKGDSIEGPKLHQQALAIDLAALGDMHPAVAATLTNLSSSLKNAGDMAGSGVAARRSLVIKEAVYGSDSELTAQSIDSIANLVFEEHDFVEAERMYARALVIHRRHLAPDHPRMAAALANYGNTLAHLGRYDEAIATIDDAIAIDRKALGDDAPSLGYLHEYLGDIALTRKRPAEALRQYESALVLWTKGYDPHNPLLGVGELGIGDAELALGHADRAVVAYQRAMEIQRDRPIDPSDRARAHLSLAKALWVTGDRAQPPELVRRAIEIYRQAGPRGDGERKEAESWLAAHR